MKIVLDTNVLISSFLSTLGPSHSILDLALKQHEVFLSTYILEEFENKLKDKFQVPQKLINQTIHLLSKRATVFTITENKNIPFPDKKDIPILSLIEATKPAYFVTGDKLLLKLKKMGPTCFLSPREAIAILG